MEDLLTQPIVCPVIVGRTAELTALRLLVDGTKGGSGQVLLLHGEAGIGKSRLVAEVKAYAAKQGFFLLQGNCFQENHFAPYGPLLDLFHRLLLAPSLRSPLSPDLQSLAQALSRYVPELRQLYPELIAPAPFPSADPEQEKRRLSASVSHFFATQARLHPVLLIIEDLHWCDEASLDLFLHLARSCTNLPFLLVLTYRSDEVSPTLTHLLAALERERLAQELALGRLAREAVDEMLLAIFAAHSAIALGLADNIYALTDGNPFFIEEVLKSLLATGGLRARDGVWERTLLLGTHLSRPRIPQSVRDAVYQRSALLSSEAKQLLRLAAVVGQRFDFSLLKQILRCDESHLLRLVKELIAVQFVVEESEEVFAFRHALTRQAISSELFVRERTSLHRTIAETVEQHVLASLLDPHLPELAYHFFEGGDWSKALEYGQRAGERALALYAPRSALEHLTRAEQAVSHLAAPLPPTLYRARAQAYETLGEFELAKADYELALALAQQTHDARMEWQCLLDLGFLWASRDYSQAGQWFHRALDLAQALADPRLQAKSLNRLGNWLVYTGRVAEGIQAHQQALHLFEALADPRGMAETFDLLGTAHCLAGDLVTAVQVSGQAVELFRNAGDLPSLAASLSLRAGYSLSETTFSPLRTRDECVQEAAEALHLSRQITSPGAEAWALLILGYVLASFGEFGSALAHARQACTIATDIGHRQWAAAASCALGITYLLQLAPNYAQDALETGLKLSREAGSTWWSIQATISLARVYLLQNELEQAEAALAAVLPREQRPRDLAERSGRLVWGELALAQGQPAMALEIAQELWETVPGAATLPGGQPIPQLLKLRGEALIALGRAEEAIPVLQEAKRGTVERYERARLWYMHGLLGRAYRLAGQEKLARQEGLAARTVIAGLSATIDEPALREQFTQAALATFWPKGAARPHQLLEAAPYNGLTAREREVAGLIAQGKSTREIAEALVLSERTVESHVANILFKLRVRSRSQIAVWAVEKGLISPPSQMLDCGSER